MKQMTGRDLIIYILSNNLEDKPVADENGGFLGFMTVSQAAVDFNVANATIEVWCDYGFLPCIRIGNERYIPALAEDPRKGGPDV